MDKTIPMMVSENERNLLMAIRENADSIEVDYDYALRESVISGPCDMTIGHLIHLITEENKKSE